MDTLIKAAGVVVTTRQSDSACSLSDPAYVQKWG